MLEKVTSCCLEIETFKLFSDFKEIVHCITTRKGGYSQDLYNSLNLSINVGDELVSVLKNREKISSFLNIKVDKLFIPRQCHTRNHKIIYKTTVTDELAETDALITNIKGHALAILAADCVPILLYDPVRQVIAAIHAGWKGTVLNIVSSTVGSMKQNFNCLPENIIAAIGPCISVEQYEVDEDVASQFNKLFNNNSAITVPGKKIAKSNINLKEANRQLLIQQGVKPENIEVSDSCTFSQPDLFFSARRDGNKCGRFASIIMLK
jgi:polyphenol oxidase